MTKQQRVAAAVLLLAAALVGLLFLMKKGSPPGPAGGKGPLVKDDLAITRTMARGEERDNGFLRLPYARRDEGVRYVNVAVDLNGDGTYAAYEKDGVRQEEWLVKDSAAFAAVGGNVGFPIDLPDRTVGAKLPADAMAVFTDAKLGGDAWPTMMPAGAVTERVHVRTYEVSDRDFFYVPKAGSRLDTGSPSPRGDRLLAVAMPGDTGAATRADGEPDFYNVQHEGIPDQDQRSSECSPTGISDSFRWLAKTYGFEDRMPSSGIGSLIDELKGDLQWDNGVTPGQRTIDGKNAFIKRRQLPLEAHMIGEEFDNNIQYKIYQELQKGQAVEVGMAFITPDGKWDGAHLVGVAGTLKIDGERWINLVDPAEPARTNGDSSESYRMNGNEVIGYDSTVKTRIRFAYAQSPVRDAGGNLVDPLRNDDLVLGPGETLAEPGSDITLSRGDFGFFQVAIDHPGDHMVGESFTTVATVTYTGKKKDLSYFANKVAKTYSFGAGRPWALKGHFAGGSNVSPDNVLLRPDRHDTSDRRERVEARFTCKKPGFGTIKYVADLFWPIDGPVIPADLPERYRKQIRQEQVMVVDSPIFRCLAPAPPPGEKPKVAPTPFCPGVVEDPNGIEVVVFRFGEKCYPAEQFHRAEPDRCDAQHWHANTGVAIALDGTKMPDPNPGGCGFAKLSEARSGIVKLSPAQAAPFIGGVLER
ncbi:MAG TPA: hypothetical protein VL500_02455 [Candidatus Eisenbacteria bacterium]|nr:hypothetical protein [Candidatus Eisenbacteria bacterium]